MKTETKAIDEINAQGIKTEAARTGVSELDFLGTFQHPKHQESRAYDISIYRFPNGTRVAATNGDEVWEESDVQGFGEMLDEYAINL